MVQTILSYLVMLFVMMMEWVFFISVVLGLGAGKLAFSFLSPPAPLDPKPSTVSPESEVSDIKLSHTHLASLQQATRLAN